MSKILNSAKNLAKIGQWTDEKLRFTWIPQISFDTLRTRDVERSPGVYIHVYRDVDGQVRHYIGGSGGDALTRARCHLYPRTDGCVGIGFVVGAKEPLTAAEAFAAERILYQIARLGGVRVQKEEPRGSTIGLERYGDLRASIGRLAIALVRAGVLPLLSAPRAIMAGPRGFVPGIDGRDLEMSATAILRRRGVDATVVIDQADRPHLQPGSQISREEAADVAAVTHMRRLEAVYGGAVSPSGIVLRPIAFPSWPAATKFCLGTLSGTERQWRRSDGDLIGLEPGTPVRPRGPENALSSVLDRVTEGGLRHV
jgi:hypothetical protein